MLFRSAVADADYVINCTRIGGLEAFATDIDIPLKYGIDQCVGDTLCAGGIMYGQRNIPQILNFVRDMKAVSKPEVLFLNYANPMAMNTWAALDAFDRGEGVNTVGLCHGVEGGWWQIDNALAVLHGHDKEKQDYRQRTQIICAGINHQTWYVKVLYKGREVGGEELLKAFENHPALRKSEKVRIDVLRRFSFYSTESNGHLSEYVPWYRKRPGEIKNWIDLSCWINGETGGYLTLEIATHLSGSTRVLRCRRKTDALIGWRFGNGLRLTSRRSNVLQKAGIELVSFRIKSLEFSKPLSGKCFTKSLPRRHLLLSRSKLNPCLFWGQSGKGAGGLSGKIDVANPGEVSRSFSNDISRSVINRVFGNSTFP